MKHKHVNGIFDLISVEESNEEELKEVGRKGAEENHSIKELEYKIKNRETEILRLHKLI